MKKLSTDFTPKNVAAVLSIYMDIPQRLDAIFARLSAEQLLTPIAVGERTPTEVMAHLVNTEERNSEVIYAALLLKEPLVLNIHSERDWGKLLRHNEMEFAELLAYFKFRRKVMLRVLGSLTDKQWLRTVREEGKARQESVYWRARGQAMHELEHIEDLENKLPKA